MAIADFHTAALHADKVDTFDVLVRIGLNAMRHGNACAHVVSYDLEQVCIHSRAEQDALAGVQV